MKTLSDLLYLIFTRSFTTKVSVFHRARARRRGEEEIGAKNSGGDNRWRGGKEMRRGSEREKEEERRGGGQSIGRRERRGDGQG